MILSTKGRYAVMAMVDLARQPLAAPVPLAAIAQRQEIPLAYLEQIFARLKRAGLVGSVRGPGGGYKLARAASATTIADIIRASEEELKMTRCDSHSHTGCMASKERCLTHDLWEGLSTHIQTYLEGISLADVLKRNVAKGELFSVHPQAPSLRGAQRRGNPSASEVPEMDCFAVARNDENPLARDLQLATHDTL